MQLTNRIRSIDMFKGIAIIMVILVHFEQNFLMCRWFRYFRMGCPILFVCSGFGIMMLISKRYPSLSESRTALKDFYLSRFKALAPGWYLAIIAVFLANSVAIMLLGSFLPFGQNREPLAILINVLFLHGLVPFGNNDVMVGGWYIGTTAILYFITPLIVFFLNTCKNRNLFFSVSSIAAIIIWQLFQLFLGEPFTANEFSFFFFLPRYPEYLLGIVLFLNLNDEQLSKNKAMTCLLAGLAAFALSYRVFYSATPLIISDWLTALATYLTLYYFISTEAKRSETIIETVLTAFGRNSYGIFLLHGFWIYFINIADKIVKYVGLSVRNIPGFVTMIPVVLFLSYFSGFVFNMITKKITRIIFG